MHNQHLREGFGSPFSYHQHITHVYINRKRRWSTSSFVIFTQRFIPYDTYGQLVTETSNVLDKTFQYVYNGNGNIVSVTAGGATTSFEYDTSLPDRLTNDAITSNSEILFSSLDAGVFSLLSVEVMKYIRIPPINTGRGSFSAISKQIYTKIKNGTISGISAKSFFKMSTSDFFDGLYALIVDVIRKITEEKNTALIRY